MAFPRVLVVDGDPSLIQMIGRELRRRREAEWYVTATCDVSLARATVVAGDADVIVTDVDTLDGSGHELQRHARMGARRIPIILLTDREIDARLARSVDEIMLKPFLVTALEALIASMLCARRAR